MISGAIAGNKTRKARQREKLFGETGGLKGFSRTRANREVTKTWSGAVAGTGGSIGMGMGGAIVGQVGLVLWKLTLTTLIIISSVYIS